MLISYKKVNIKNRRTFSGLARSLTQITDYCKDHPYIVTGSVIAVSCLTAFVGYQYYQNNQFENNINNELSSLGTELNTVSCNIAQSNNTVQIVDKLKEVQPIIDNKIGVISRVATEGLNKGLLDTSYVNTLEYVLYLIKDNLIQGIDNLIYNCNINHVALAVTAGAAIHIITHFNRQVKVFQKSERWFITLFEIKDGPFYVRQTFKKHRLVDMLNASLSIPEDIKDRLGSFTYNTMNDISKGILIKYDLVSKDTMEPSRRVNIVKRPEPRVTLESTSFVVSVSESSPSTSEPVVAPTEPNVSTTVAPIVPESSASETVPEEPLDEHKVIELVVASTEPNVSTSIAPKESTASDNSVIPMSNTLEEDAAEDNKVSTPIENAMEVANSIPKELNKVIDDIAKTSNIIHKKKIKIIKTSLDEASSNIILRQELMRVLLNKVTFVDKKTLEVVWDIMSTSVLNYINSSKEILEEEPTNLTVPAVISSTFTEVLVIYKFQLDLFIRHHNWFTRLCKYDEELVVELFKQSTEKEMLAMLNKISKQHKKKLGDWKMSN